MQSAAVGYTILKMLIDKEHHSSLKILTHVVAAQLEHHVDVQIILEKPLKLHNIVVLQSPMDLDLCL